MTQNRPKRAQIGPKWLGLARPAHSIEFYLPVTIVIIPDVLVTNLITKLSKSCLVVMTCQTMLAGMKVSITGTQNSHAVDGRTNISQWAKIGQNSLKYGRNGANMAEMAIIARKRVKIDSK